MNHIGEALRFVRQSMGMEQREVADKANISNGHLSAIELGHRDPSWGVIQKVCGALEVDASMVTLLLHSGRPEIKPLAPIVYNYLWEKTREHRHGST